MVLLLVLRPGASVLVSGSLVRSWYEDWLKLHLFGILPRCIFPFSCSLCSRSLHCIGSMQFWLLLCFVFSWSIKVELELMLDKTETIMITICFEGNENNEHISENCRNWNESVWWLGLWIRHAKCKDDDNSIKWWTVLEVEGIRWDVQRRHGGNGMLLKRLWKVWCVPGGLTVEKENHGGSQLIRAYLENGG